MISKCLKLLNNNKLVVISSLFLLFTSCSSWANTTSNANLWQLIAKQIVLKPHPKDWRLQRQIHWFAAHPKEVEQLMRNAKPYLYLIYQQVRQHHMPIKFVLLPMIESGYNPNAHSWVGAVGLWQLMSDTAASFGIHINWWYDGRRDIYSSTEQALNFLVKMHHALGSWPLTAAAYNAGIGTVENAMAYNRSRHLSTSYWALPLPNQTLNYVPKLLALAQLIKYAKRYGIHYPHIVDKPYLGKTTLTSQMDLAEIAHLAGTSVALVKRYNPAIRRYATAPNQDYVLLLPYRLMQHFRHQLALVIGKKHLSWQYYRVQNGQTLASISAHFHTRLTLLKKANYLNNDRLHPGQGLLVPVALGKVYTQPVRTLKLTQHAHVITQHQSMPMGYSVALTALAHAKVFRLPVVNKASISKAQRDHNLLNEVLGTKAHAHHSMKHQHGKRPDDLKVLLEKIYGD